MRARRDARSIEGMETSPVTAMDVTVVVATFGERRWADVALGRAIPSAQALRVPVVHAHRPTRHEALNAGLAAVRTTWVCHLEADDELEPGFMAAMAAGTADLRAPSVRQTRRGAEGAHARMPKVPGHAHACDGACLEQGNWLAPGTVARTALIRQVGGWRDWPAEGDWDVWLRCHLAGATVQAVPGAVYRERCRAGARRRAVSRLDLVETRWAIHQACLRPAAPGSRACA